MTIQTDYSLEEWTSLIQVSIMVGLAVIASIDSDITSTRKEMRILRARLENVDNRFEDCELIQTLAPLSAIALKTTRKRYNLRKDGERIKAEALRLCQQVSTTLGQKTPLKDANTFKHWLILIGEQVAQVTVNGERVGHGGENDLPAEEHTLKAISDMLTVTLQS